MLARRACHPAELRAVRVEGPHRGVPRRRETGVKNDRQGAPSRTPPDHPLARDAPDVSSVAAGACTPARPAPLHSLRTTTPDGASVLRMHRHPGSSQYSSQEDSCGWSCCTGCAPVRQPNGHHSEDGDPGRSHGYDRPGTIGERREMVAAEDPSSGGLRRRAHRALLPDDSVLPGDRIQRGRELGGEHAMERRALVNPADRHPRCALPRGALVRVRSHVSRRCLEHGAVLERPPVAASRRADSRRPRGHAARRSLRLDPPVRCRRRSQPPVCPPMANRIVPVIEQRDGQTWTSALPARARYRL